MKAPIEKGNLVISKKGRDKGRLFVVLYTLDAEYVLLCDGSLRKVSHPKKKKRMHLAPTAYACPELPELYEQGRLLDSDVRTALAPYQTAATD